MDCLTDFDEKLYEKMRYEEGYEDGAQAQLAADQEEIAALKAENEALRAQLSAN